MCVAIVLLTGSLIGNNYKFIPTDNFKKFDGVYELTIDPPGKRDTMTFEFNIAGGKIVKLTSDKAKINDDGSMTVDVSKQCQRFKKVTKGATIGTAVMLLVLVLHQHCHL